MGEVEYSVWIEAAPEQVWRTYVDPTRIPLWQTGKPVIRDVRGAPGEPGSSYVSQRGRLVAHTTILTADAPHSLVTTTDAYLGLSFQVTSRLSERSGGTDLTLLVATHWRRGHRVVVALVERAVLSPREAHKELTALKVLVEGRSSP
jgi:uncharacterized protein YndB with AHSA1/START domain